MSSMHVCIGIAVLAGVLGGCDSHRYYQLSPLSGVVEIDVVTNLREPAGNIVKPEQVAAITAFMNARLDHWYDSHGVGFGTTGNLAFLDAHHKRIAYISFGTGGMYQTRPNMTYTDSVKRHEFQVTRNPPDKQGENDKAELCGLLGSRFQRAVCDVHY
jgi:hypothetical protein